MPGKDVTTMNKVILMGRLTKNPEIKYAGKDNDMAVARYTLSHSERVQSLHRNIFTRECGL